MLEISPPRNDFPLHRARFSLLLGGGIGLTPLLPMAQQLAGNTSAFELHYYNKSRADAAFLSDLQGMPWRQHAHCHFSDESQPTGQRIADLLSRVDPLTHVYACGPAGFIEHVVQCAIGAGLSNRQVHYEAFALPASFRPDYSGPAFQVQMKSTGRLYTIPADVPPTRALERQGIRIPVSCEEGNCGTCKTGIVRGIPDHRDVYLSEAEHASNQVFTPCCSRAGSNVLVLDL